LIKKIHHRAKFPAGGVPQIIIGLKDEIPDNAHGTWQAVWSLVVLSEAPRHCGLWCYAFAMAGDQAWMDKRLEMSARQGLARGSAWNVPTSIAMEKALLDGMDGSSLLTIFCLAKRLRFNCSSVNAPAGWLDGVNLRIPRMIVADRLASLPLTVVVAPFNP
jgi:hypothetical protein